MTSDRKWLIPKYIGFVVLAAIFVFRLGGCSSTPGVKIAQMGVAHFRSQMEAGEFQAIYAEADEGLRQKYNEKDFVKLVAAIDRAGGTLKQARLSRARESWFSHRDKYVTLDYETTWARTKGEEKFIFHIRQGHANLDTYKVYAPYPALLSGISPP